VPDAAPFAARALAVPGWFEAIPALAELASTVRKVPVARAMHIAARRIFAPLVHIGGLALSRGHAGRVQLRSKPMEADSPETTEGKDFALQDYAIEVEQLKMPLLSSVALTINGVISTVMIAVMVFLNETLWPSIICFAGAVLSMAVVYFQRLAPPVAVYLLSRRSTGRTFRVWIKGHITDEPLIILKAREVSGSKLKIDSEGSA
jgi:hypothetical protein